MRWNGKRIVRWCHRNPNIAKALKEIVTGENYLIVWERYCNASTKPELFFIFFVYIFIHISANMSPFGLTFSQMILHTETSKLIYNWSFLFVVLHKPTLLPSTFKFKQPNNKTCWCEIWYMKSHSWKLWPLKIVRFLCSKNAMWNISGNK